MSTALPALAPWASFYNFVGSSAAALIGLQFVVAAFVAEARRVRREALEAFVSPTVVHFCAVLLISAIVGSPWRTEPALALSLTLTGAAGTAYALVVTWRAIRQRDYAPVLEDWLWHNLFPLAAYVGLTLAAFLGDLSAGRGLFTVAAMALFLLFIGIHNAWDTVAYSAVQRPNDRNEAGDGAGRNA